MPTIYLLDDQEFVRERLREELLKIDPQFTIIEFGSDADGKDDCKFVSTLTQLRPKLPELSQYLILIDVHMNVSEEWKKKEEKDKVNKKATSPWFREFSTSDCHGFNIYNAIRSKHELLKIATITVSPVKLVLQCRSGKPLPQENKYYRHIHAIGHYEKIAKEINNFFKS